MDAMGYVPVCLSLAPKLGPNFVSPPERRNIKPKAPLALQCFRQPFGMWIQAELVAPKKMCFFPTGIFETIWTKMTSKMTSMIFGFQVFLEISWNFLLFTGISLGGIPGYPKNICFYWWAMCLVALFTGRLTQQLEPVQPCSKDVSREFSELRDL